MSRSALALLDDFPAELRARIKPQFDREVLARMLRLTATACFDSFQGQLQHHFPGAAFVSKPGEVTTQARFASLLGPIKGVERMLVKWDEYCAEGDDAGLYFASQIKDLLRCTILVQDGDALWEAWERIQRGFDVGRLKNNMATSKHQPPNMLISVVVHTDGSPPIVGEIQIFLLDIKNLAESAGHRYYEIRRAPTWGDLYAEATKPESAPPPSDQRSRRTVSPRSPPKLLPIKIKRGAKSSEDGHVVELTIANTTEHDRSGL